MSHPPTAQPPMTLEGMIEQLREQLEATNQEIDGLSSRLARRREHAAYLRGQLEAYASIRLIDPNPATLDHDSGAAS
jgi:hypothetical protein